MALTRREFLRAAGVGTVGLGVGTPFGVAAAAAPRERRAAGDLVVVFVLLGGGNDGLNTIVPLRQYDRYRTLRPTLAWPREALIVLPGYADDFALNPGLQALMPLCQQGRVAIINGCSTPVTAQGLFDHDASTYNCLTGETYGSAPPHPPTGWLGRYLDGVEPGELPLGIDFGSIGVALSGTRATPLSLYSINGFGVFPSIDAEARYAAYTRIQQAIGGSAADSHGQALRRRIIAVTGAFQEIAAAYRVAPGVVYPPTYISANLQDCAALILADRGVRALTVTLGGFDTHGDQNSGPPETTGVHQSLWTMASEAIAAFHADLTAQGAADRVLIVLASEFGRRAVENGDLGTDHGLAGPMLAIGDAVAGGVYGEYPDLREEYLVLDGNLDLRVDFRSVYATVLAQHLGVDPGPILRGDFPLVGFL